jgi:hypothetical protein
VFTPPWLYRAIIEFLSNVRFSVVLGVFWLKKLSSSAFFEAPPITLLVLPLLVAVGTGVVNNPLNRSFPVELLIAVSVQNNPYVTGLNRNTFGASEKLPNPNRS